MSGKSWLKALGQYQAAFDENGNLVFSYIFTIGKTVMTISVGNNAVKSFEVFGTLVDCVISIMWVLVEQQNFIL